MLIPAARLSAWGHCTLAPRVGTVVRRVGTFGRAACSVAAMFNCEARSVVQRVRSCMHVRSCSAFNRAARSITRHVQSRCAFECGPRSNVARVRTWPAFGRGPMVHRRRPRSIVAAFNRAARSIVQRVQSCSAFNHAPRSIALRVRMWGTPGPESRSDSEAGARMSQDLNAECVAGSAGTTR